MSQAEPGWGRDGAVVGLLSAGHFFSHFYMLALPPLFPVLKAEFGVSYTALGGIVAAFSVASGAAQYPMGVLVDRLGARYLLIAGLVLLSSAFGLMAFSESYLALVVLAFVGGLGNSIFHPANYTIMGATVSPGRLGRAFGIHTFAGQMGWVAAPPLMIFLASLVDWRSAMGIVGLLGLAVALLLTLQRGRLEGGGRPARDQAAVSGAVASGAAASGTVASGAAASGAAPGAAANPTTISSAALLLSPAILLMFLFFVTQAGVQIGIQSFTPTALGELFATPLVAANAALTGFLMGGAGGVLMGGVIADRLGRPGLGRPGLGRPGLGRPGLGQTGLGRLGLVATVGYTASGAAMCVAALVAMPVPALVAVFVFSGLMLGSIAPSRDLVVRAIAPPGASGRVFGFVSTGLDVGGVLSPLLFGWILDQGWPSTMFLAAAGMMMLSLAAGLAAARVRAPSASPAAAE